MPNPIKVRAEVLSIEEHGSGTYAVKLAAKGIAPRHRPGQFLHLTVDEYDPAGGFWPESRVFSIASAPGAPQLEIVYSVKGRYTRLMEERLRPGYEVWLKLPFGDFIIDSAIKPGQDVVMIAGGTGVSPFLPFIEKLDGSAAREGKVRLYYGIRENPMLLGRELLARRSKDETLDLRLFVENEEPEAGLPGGGTALRGRLDVDRIHAESGDLEDPVFFLSGPPGMIKAFKARLVERGVSIDNIKIDEWE